MSPVPTDPYTFVVETLADPSEVNARFDPLYAALNGALDEANMAVPKGLFYAYRNGALSLANAGVALFDSERFDTSGWFDTSTGRFTPQVAGYYRLSWCLRLGVAGDTFNVLAVLYKNGAVHADGACLRAVPSSAVASSGSAVVQANGTSDYFDVRLVHDYAGTVGLEPGAAASYLCGELIGRS